MLKQYSPYVVILSFVLGCLACKKNPLSPATLHTETEPPTLLPVTIDVNEDIGGYYKALPSKYETSLKRYPLLVFIHGGGGFGNGESDLPKLLDEGIPKLLEEKLFPSEFYVNGQYYSFIHLAPQFRKYPTAGEVNSFIQYATKHFRVDVNRIYITGMSLGGRFTCDVAAAFPTLAAAIVPISGVSDTFNVSRKCAALANGNLPIWVFHNDSDQVFSIRLPINFIASINRFHPIIAPKLTILPSMGLLGHDAWTRATDPGFKEDNKNIYEWMLQYERPQN